MKNSRRSFISKSTLGVGALSTLSFINKSNSKIDLKSIKDGLPNNGNEFWADVKNLFPTDKNDTYFNNGTLGVQSNYVLNAVINDMRNNAINGAKTDYKGEGPNLLAGYDPYLKIREKLGMILNCNFKEISLIQNATFGMNFVAHGLNLKKGDEVINTNQEHGGGYAAWKQLEKRKGIVYKQAILPVPANSKEDIIDSVLSMITSKTKVIAIPHIVSVYGTVMPIKEICEFARQKGIFTVIDGAQAVGQIDVDLKDLSCDAYYSSLHKWLLSPPGNGILYLNNSISKDIWPTLSSYNWDNKEDKGFSLQQSGTGNPSLRVGLEASIDFFNMIGREKWIKRVKHLGKYLRDGLKELDNVEIVSSHNEDLCAGLTTYKVDGISGPELQKTLWERERLQPRSVGKELLRHSVHIYNNEQEIDRTFDVIKSI
tara:strand:- start:7 stop:1290 length:1284 start_codon:yes stop_codon:yes gene_type:complete